MKKVAVIGAGLIGKERLSALKNLKESGYEIEITGICDPYCKNINEIADKYKTKVINDLDELIKTNSDWYFIAVPHDIASEIILKLTKTNSKILIEKPFGRSLEEANELFNILKNPNQLFVGFNYRFYECISMLIKDIKENKFGSLVSIDFLLGHGGSPALKDGWKLDPVKAGGGCILDPGIHLIDLCRIITDGNMKPAGGLTWSGFWKTGIEEEAHVLFESGNTIINLQLSVVRWRNTFHISANGTDGYGNVSGRGKFYGKRTYTTGERWAWMDKKVSQKETEKEFIGGDDDDSFTRETLGLLFPEKSKEFLKPCTAIEALENMKIWNECMSVVKKAGGEKCQLVS